MAHTAELIAVGTELLLGNIVNTNARELSEALSGLGMTTEEYMAKVEAVTMDQVVAAANTVQLHTTYFLKGGSQ